LLRWNVALTAVGLTGVRFHDLRHTGNTLAARSGVSTRDLMTRMGHDSVRAAIIYQHATTEADARIAGSLDADIAGAVDGGQVDGDEGGGVVLPFG
jgi:integrase